MEKRLVEWYKNYHDEKGNIVTTRLFKQKAKEFSSDPTIFRASKGWLQKFKKRYQINFK